MSVNYSTLTLFDLFKMPLMALTADFELQFFPFNLCIELVSVPDIINGYSTLPLNCITRILSDIMETETLKLKTSCKYEQIE
jgi:hypothetical protein